jgi:hypothetical protein
MKNAFKNITKKKKHRIAGGRSKKLCVFFVSPVYFHEIPSIFLHFRCKIRLRVSFSPLKHRKTTQKHPFFLFFSAIFRPFWAHRFRHCVWLCADRDPAVVAVALALPWDTRAFEYALIAVCGRFLRLFFRFWEV